MRCRRNWEVAGDSRSLPSRQETSPGTGSLLPLAIFVWPGLLFWAVLVFFIAGRGVPPPDDVTPISAGRRWLGFATFLALILIPLPHAFRDAAGTHRSHL